MRTAFTAPGNGEAAKAAVHGALLTLAVMCGVYNVAACCRRPERHLVVNVGAYWSLVAFEVVQVWRHTRS